MQRPAGEPPQPGLRASTSSLSLDDLAREEGAAAPPRVRAGDKDAHAPQRTSASPVRQKASGKGKEHDCNVELAVLNAEGAKESVLPEDEHERGDTDGALDGRVRAAAPVGGNVVDGAGAQSSAPAPAARTSSPRRPRRSPSPPALSSAPAGFAATARPPLQSILKRPEAARAPSSFSSVRSASAQLLPPSGIAPPAPASPSGPVIALPPLARTISDTLAPATPDSLDAKDSKSPSFASPAVHPSVLFSTPGTTTSVLPLSSPSHASASSLSSPSAASASLPDPTGTFKSWKSSVMGRRSGVYDRKRLAALGFEEELTRDYDFWASWGIALCNIGGLPGTVLGVLTALEKGGGSMYAIAWPISGLFMLCLAAVLGEMASTWPVAGAMFTWVFRLCRSRKWLDPWARYASWVVGSLLLCSHILLQIIVTWQFAHNLLGVIGLWTDKRYDYWVVVVICWGILTFSALVVSSRVSRSPWLWRICGGLIVAFFFIINITLLTTADEIYSAEYVFTSYRNTSGFTSKSYVYMLGWVLTCVATGMEASAHMAEDTKRPARTVPLAMFWSVAATYGMGWVSICVLLATMHLDGSDPDLQPSIALIANSIPRKYTTLILVLVLLSFLFQNIAQLLATSRFIWALSRESALPFSKFFRRLSSKTRQPTVAIWATWAISFPALLLIAVNVSIIATTLLEGAGITCTSSYVAPLLFYLACWGDDVLRGDGRAKWTLRGASKFLAIPPALFLLVFITMMCLPTGYPVTPLNMSYASVMLVGVLLVSTLAWVLYGNGHYAGPIKTTTRWTIGAEVDLPSSSSHGTKKPPSRKKPSAAAAAAAAAAPTPSSGNGVGSASPAEGTTTSAQHGASAHVWATSVGEASHAWTYGSSEGGEGRSAVRRGAGARTMDEEEAVTTVGRTTGTGSEWSEWTEGDEEDSDEDDDDEEEDSEEDDDERRSRRSRGAGRSQDHPV
ncbi:uncharacterized protein JCM10292_005088 [Rhodotorula paludigena]|uniref:uncharacterized protein n=1 Tax=Rhodotorula paludigena TaxID=86838 RepID=UPI003175D78A